MRGMAWSTAADLLRDLVNWEHTQPLPGRHWPWHDDVLPFEGIQHNAATPVAVIDGARVSARRALWVAVWGELPADVDLTGSCAVPSCVRPAHGHVLPIVGRPIPGLHPHVPLSLLRWDAAWGGRGAERRGRTDLRGRHVPLEERRRPASSGVDQLLELLDLGERPGP
jgi:hypothetical protein